MKASLALALTLLGAVVAAHLGCQKTPEPDAAKAEVVPPTPAPPSASSAAPPTPAHVVPPGTSVAPSASAAASPTPGDMQWDVPKAWTTAPSTSSMRKATYKIPKAAPDTEDAEMSVTQVGGGVEANITRWAGQFGGATPTRTKRKVNGLDVTLVELRGTFAGSGMPGAPPGAPKEKQALLGAVVETEPTFFFKLTGGEKTIEKAKPDFEKLVGSFRAK